MQKKKHTLLVIEDNELNRDILQAMLEDEFNLMMAKDGKEGLAVMRANALSLRIVLLDIQMPVMNGYEVLEEMAKDEHLRNIPVIVTTSNAGQEEEAKCLKLGATDFVMKPYNPYIVRQRIHNIINLKESTTTLEEVVIDAVTGVYTQNAFKYYARQRILDNPEINYTLIFTDIVGFKHHMEKVGDDAMLLVVDEINLLRENMGEEALYGRVGYDEFLCLLPTPFAGLSEAERVAKYEATVAELSKRLKVTVKAAIYENIDCSMKMQIYIDRAAHALESVKHKYNQHVSLVSEAMLSRMNRRMDIETQMESALREGQLCIYFQPKHHASTGKLVGVEALLRWNHPTFGFLSPAEFIPIFEQTGFIVEADAFAWSEACRHLRKWQDAGYQVVPVSVNTTRYDYTRNGFDERLLDPIKKYDIDPTLLHIEVTESLLANIHGTDLHLLERCRLMGIKIELDDFGTGYSSLHSMVELPIDIVKFDQSFVRKLSDPKEYDVMSCCIQLVKRMSLSAVAEGVETDDHKNKVMELGIDVIQGYYYAKPMPADEFEAYLQAHAVMTSDEYADALAESRQRSELERLRKQAQEDPLTGLYNRYVVYHRVKDMFSQKEPFIYAVFDVDNFKYINDTYGHPTGDMALVKIAQLMMQQFRTDICVRLGGDEFAVIIDRPLTPEALTIEMARFFYQIETLHVPHMEGHQLSVSMGCAFYNGEEDITLEHLYSKADKLLYQSKQSPGCKLTL